MAQLIVLKAVVDQSCEEVRMTMKVYERGFHQTFLKILLTTKISRYNTPCIVKYVLNLRSVKREVLINSFGR